MRNIKKCNTTCKSVHATFPVNLAIENTTAIQQGHK